MNREILFRGKRIDNGEWVEGGYGEIPAPPVCIGEPRKPTVCIVARDSNYMPDWGLPYRMAMYEVEPSTVDQYTGSTDKNGIRVFEGDVLDCGDRIVYVRWHNECAQWDSEFIRYQGKLCSNGITSVEWKFRATVIGNIHDGKDGQHDEL